MVFVGIGNLQCLCVKRDRCTQLIPANAQWTLKPPTTNGCNFTGKSIRCFEITSVHGMHRLPFEQAVHQG